MRSTKMQLISSVLATALALPAVALGQAVTPNGNSNAGPSGANAPVGANPVSNPHPEAATAAESNQTATTSPGNGTAAGTAPATPTTSGAARGATQGFSASPAQIGANWQAHVDQRIEAMRTALHISGNENQAFNRFAQVMHENASAMSKLVQQRASELQSMSALDNMRSYEKLANQHAEDVRRLTAAFQTLYEQLTPEQKQQADQMFRQQANERAAAHNG